MYDTLFQTPTSKFLDCFADLAYFANPASTFHSIKLEFDLRIKIFHPRNWIFQFIITLEKIQASVGDPI